MDLDDEAGGDDGGVIGSELSKVFTFATGLSEGLFFLIAEDDEGLTLAGGSTASVLSPFWFSGWTGDSEDSMAAPESASCDT